MSRSTEIREKKTTLLELYEKQLPSLIAPGQSFDQFNAKVAGMNISLQIAIFGQLSEIAAQLAEMNEREAR